MPKYGVDQDGNPLPEVEKIPCQGIRIDLKDCLLATDCCQKEKKTPRECLQRGDVPQRCHELHHLLFECKHSLVNRRKQFRAPVGY